METIRLKVVPQDTPNADGHWIHVAVSDGIHERLARGGLSWPQQENLFIGQVPDGHFMVSVAGVKRPSDLPELGVRPVTSPVRVEPDAFCTASYPELCAALASVGAELAFRRGEPVIRRKTRNRRVEAVPRNVVLDLRPCTPAYLEFENDERN